MSAHVLDNEQVDGSTNASVLVDPEVTDATPLPESTPTSMVPALTDMSSAVRTRTHVHDDGTFMYVVIWRFAFSVRRGQMLPSVWE